MELYLNLTVLFYVLHICCQYADALIGLRPPRKTPPKDKPDNKQMKPVTPLPTQLIAPTHNPSTGHNLTINEDSSGKDDISLRCHSVPLLRCSFRLLRQSLQNESSICRQVQDFSQCSKSKLRQDGRKDFAVGSFILDEFTRTINNKHECHGNGSSSLLKHHRHQRSKRLGSQCCVEGIIDCAVRTFLKMTHNPGERCPLLDYYELCLHETSTNTCDLKSLRTVYPVFTTQLKRRCKTTKIRTRRNGIRNVFKS